MIAGIVLISLVCLVVLAFVSAPLWRGQSTAALEDDDEAVRELRELHARQQMLLAGLRDLEDDRATDKLDDADYEQLERKLSAQAMEVMRRLDAAELLREEQLERARQASKPLRYPGRRRTGPET